MLDFTGCLEKTVRSPFYAVKPVGAPETFIKPTVTSINRRFYAHFVSYKIRNIGKIRKHGKTVSSFGPNFPNCFFTLMLCNSKLPTCIGRQSNMSVETTQLSYTVVGPNNQFIFRNFDMNNELLKSSLFQYFFFKSHKMAILLQFLVNSRWFYDCFDKVGVI